MASRALRPTGEDAPQVTNTELFFDLVYVFAITQLSEFLVGHLTARGALETLILFSAVWWAWNYTAWATNWIDPDSGSATLLIVVLMAVGLLMAAAIPRAFAGRSVPFAVAYVALQLLRTGFVTVAFPRASPMRANNGRLLGWLAIAGAVWIVGALLRGDARLIAWLVAVALDLAAPLHGFWLPGLGSLPIERWELSGSHLAERYQLVLIIALGESVLRVGLTASEEAGSLGVDAAFVVGFLVSAGLWASYFLRYAELGARVVAASSDRARIGRSGYVYFHEAMVAGVIVVAVAVRLMIEAPEEPSSLAFTLTALGGPALFLAGLGGFERFVGVGRAGRSLLAVVGLAVLAVVTVAGADRLVLGICVALVLLGLVAATVRPSASGADER